MNHLLTLLTVLVGLSSLPTRAQAQIFAIDSSKSVVGFEAMKLIDTHIKGRFDSFSGEFTFNADDPTKSSLKAEIICDSFDTSKDNAGIWSVQSGKRDKVVKGQDFLDCANNPKIKFESTKAIGDDDHPDKLTIMGKLTIKGVTKDVTLNAVRKSNTTDSNGHKVVTYSAETKINRQDFGVKGDASAVGLKLRDELALNFNIEGVETDASARAVAPGEPSRAALMKK